MYQTKVVNPLACALLAPGGDIDANLWAFFVANPSALSMAQYGSFAMPARNFR